MENKEIEAVAVLGEKRQSGLEGRSREEQPPGRVLFTLEDLKQLSRGKLRTNWKERRGNRTRGGKGREGGRNRAESSDGKPARTRRAGLARRGVGTQAGPEEALEKLEGAGGWRAESGRQRQAGERGEGGEGSTGTRRQGSMGPSGAAWGARPRGAQESCGVRAAAVPARTLALNSAAASTLFSDMVPGPGLAGSRGPGAGTEGPWTAEGGRGRNLARWRRRRRQRQRRPLSKLGLWKRRQRRAGWGGGGSGAGTRRAAAVRRTGGRTVRVVAGALRPRSLGPRFAAPATAELPPTSRCRPRAENPLIKAALSDGRGFPGVGLAGAGRRGEGRRMKTEVGEVGIGG